MKYFPNILLAAAFFIISCSAKEDNFDASGSFEAEETIIASEAAGVIKVFNLQEGQTLQAGQTIGYIDSLQLYLKKKQLQAQIGAVLSKKPNVSTQIASLQEQLKAAQREQKRLRNLVQVDAATPQQLDNMNAQVEVLQRQISAQRSALTISTESLSQEAIPLQVQIDQVNDQLQKCRLINPVNGTVLAKYAEEKEIAAPGKPLYRIANLSTLNLRAYITGDQLSRVKLNQPVTVLVDNGPDTYKEYPGTITWINNKSEFTPKTIQTKDERANLVYATKIKVKNDGFLKLGMYAEVKF